MNDQITLDGFEPVDYRENQALRDLLPIFSTHVAANGGLSDLLEIKATENYTVLYYGNMTAFRLRIRGKSHYISVPTVFSDLIPDDAPQKSVKSEQKYLRVLITESYTLDHYTAMLAEIAGETVNRYPKEWDCCSRYLECSDAKTCTHPDKAFALSCGYRKILSSGHIFYGKNRNV